MHFRCVIDSCGLCAGRFGLGSPMMFLNFACHMLMHFSCICYIFSFLFWLWCVLSISRIDYAMAPKARKSTPTRNPLQGFESSSSDSHVPLHVRFFDEKARKDFSENFQYRGIHLERQVILSDFAETHLPDVIRSRGWASLLKSHLRCPVVFILEFYSIIHDIDTDVPQFVTTFKGTHIVVTPESYIRGTTCSQGNTS